MAHDTATARPSLKTISFVASQTEEAVAARERLVQQYGDSGFENADAIVALGGDGLMLQTGHRFMDSGKPIYGMHCGSVGFLMNDFDTDDLIARLNAAETSEIHPLVMRATDIHGKMHMARAINEVSMLRQTHQAAKLRVSVDDRIRLPELICDGILVATPAGSTAYNLSAQGPILPINSPLLALTPISPFRPRRWRGALLPNGAHITIDVLDAEKRPTAAVADHKEVRDVCKVQVSEDASASILMLFDPGHNLDERILREQFIY